MEKIFTGDTRRILRVGDELAEMPAEDAEARRQIYAEYVRQAHAIQESYSEKFDKLILGYSSSGLAISVSIFKDFFLSSSTLGFPFLLFVSWISFVLAILVVAVSYRMNQKASMESMETARQGLIGLDDEALSYGPGRWAIAAGWATTIAAFLFFTGVVTTIAFPIVTKMPAHSTLGIPQPGPVKIAALWVNPQPTRR